MLRATFQKGRVDEPGSCAKKKDQYFGSLENATFSTELAIPACCGGPESAKSGRSESDVQNGTPQLTINAYRARPRAFTPKPASRVRARESLAVLPYGPAQ